MKKLVFAAVAAIALTASVSFVSCNNSVNVAADSTACDSVCCDTMYEVVDTVVADTVAADTL
ncbi:MAG: hypothetical protein J1F40_04270 [Prevotellaceae bacterium]|nr:hypothetical protein [Prevotellaceae bacterium]